MKNEYGDVILHMEQFRLKYSIPNHGQIDRIFNEQAFYIYELFTDKDVHAAYVGPFDIITANRFAEHNGLCIRTYH